MRLAANLNWLFTELDRLDRPKAALECGFNGVEVLSPYDYPATDWQAALNGCPVCLINTPAHDDALGCAAVPGSEDVFRKDFARAIDYAQAMRAGLIHVLAGRTDAAEAAMTYRRNLEWASENAQGLRVTIEPLNPIDMPGYFLSDFGQAVMVLDDLDAENIGLQFDVWHARRMGADLRTLWHRVAPYVTHVQIAGLAVRAEPCADALSFARGILAGGYAGWLAAEYAPSAARNFGWVEQFRSVS